MLLLLLLLLRLLAAAAPIANAVARSTAVAITAAVAVAIAAAVTIAFAAAVAVANFIAAAVAVAIAAAIPTCIAACRCPHRICSLGRADLRMQPGDRAVVIALLIYVSPTAPSQLGASYLLTAGHAVCFSATTSSHPSWLGAKISMVQLTHACLLIIYFCLFVPLLYAMT